MERIVETSSSSSSEDEDEVVPKKADATETTATSSQMVLREATGAQTALFCQKVEKKNIKKEEKINLLNYYNEITINFFNVTFS